MSRPTLGAAPRNLTLTEELEKLEQSITLTLQEIDSNFSKAHRIVTTSILPIVDEYAKHSNDVWEGSKFWKQFFEASANVSLSGYEEPANEEDVTNTETTSTQLETPTDNDEYAQGGPQQQQQDQDEDEEDFTVDSPTQVTGTHATPKLSGSTKKNAVNTKSPATFRSPSPRKYTGKNPRAFGTPGSEGPSTPRSQASAQPQSSPFEPESAYQPSGQRSRSNNQNDPLMHRVLDKNYRIQATPHTQRRQRQQAAAAAAKPTPQTATKTAPWDDSPQSSPAMAAPQLRSDLFSPDKPSRPNPNGPRTPGISVLTPAARRTGGNAPTTSTGRQLFSPQDKAFSAAGRPRNPLTTANNTQTNTNNIFSSPFASDDVSDDEANGFGMSPPKTMQFHVPQSRLLQTPAREASKRIVEDLLLTAGAEDTDEIEGKSRGGAEDEEIDFTEPSPSVVKRAWMDEDDTF